jgi:hypothetical protein
LCLLHTQSGACLDHHQRLFTILPGDLEWTSKSSLESYDQGLRSHEILTVLRALSFPTIRPFCGGGDRECLFDRQSQSNQRVHMIWPGFGMGKQLRDALSERARHRALSEQKLPLNGGCIAGASHTRSFVQRMQDWIWRRTSR